MPRRSGSLLVLVLLQSALLGCGDDPPLTPVPLTRLSTDRTYLRDANGRYIYVHGINVTGESKLPKKVDPNGIPTYVGRPFAREEADAQFARLQRLGFSAVRLLVSWEGIEPLARGEYDRAYLAYLREMVVRAGQHGLYVLLDMHQDLFSRHLQVKYNNKPQAAAGSAESALLALVEPYNDIFQGDGAPRWAVSACLQEKKMSSKFWGTPRVVSGLDGEALGKLLALYLKLTGSSGTGTSEPPPAWITQFLTGLPGTFGPNETPDLLPFTNFAVTYALSLDAARCYACLFAGDKVFPGLTQDGEDVKEYLQEGLANAWYQVASEVHGLPNVMGYDLYNEPGGNFITLTAAAVLVRSGALDAARSTLIRLLGDETGKLLHESLTAFHVFPPDTAPETLAAYGLDKIDPAAVAALNYGFSDNYLRPFYERLAASILRADPKAVIFYGDASSLSSVLSGGGASGMAGNWELPLKQLRGVKNQVFAPHWYPDVYPYPGFNVEPRSFTSEQVRYRDYSTSLRSAMSLANYSLGQLPAVFGEFGSYFNLNGIENAVADNYTVVAHILDNEYQGFEKLFVSRFVWCYGAENDAFYGDGWNHEDFSLFGPGQVPRAELAWGRPHARALAGKPISTHFYSDLHYFNPQKGLELPRREFEVRYASKETPAPTEIMVPTSQYPDGFYVWVSDGRCHYDPKSLTLYHYPSEDVPDFVHWVRVLPRLPNRESKGWSYYFKGESAVVR